MSRLSKSETVIYTHRNFPSKMRDRVRLLATLKSTTMEAIVVEALSIGLKPIEQEAFKTQGVRRVSA